jgi:diaminopimelate epimerase
MRFAKGHGTGNDFLILPDPDGALVLSPELVARLCDRRTGLGADGILRAVPVAAGHQAGGLGAADWFMDYRNADGSTAEMCGNGVRVFARYLLARGLADGPAFVVATRAGLRQVWEEASGEITVDMGAPLLLGRSVALVGAMQCHGLAVSLGNPHLACMVDGPVADFDLSAPPVVDPARFPDGANVEVVRVPRTGTWRCACMSAALASRCPAGLARSRRPSRRLRRTSTRRPPRAASGHGGQAGGPWTCQAGRSSSRWERRPAC